MQVTDSDWTALCRKIHSGRASSGDYAAARPIILASLYRFSELFWPLVEPRVFISNWHVRTMAEALEEVVSPGAASRQLLINCPPGVSKSLLVCVFFATWMLARRPSWKGLFTSHSERDAVRDSLKSRRIIESRIFQAIFPEVRLQKDANTTSLWETTAGGVRQAQGVGLATGRRVNCTVIDDPYAVMTYYSRAERAAVHTWVDEALPSRQDDPLVDVMIVVMQRLGPDDLSAHLLTKGGWRHVCLTAEYDPSLPKELAPGDPRTEPGEPMFPQLQPREVLEQFKSPAKMGLTAFSAQYNQRPVDLVGGMFPARWWRFWRPDGVGVDREKRPAGSADFASRVLPARLDQTLVSVDCAFRDGVKNDWVVMQLWGAHGADRYLLEQVRGHFDAVVTAERLKDLADRKKPDRILIEGKANGDAVVSMLQGKIPGIISVDPGRDGKEGRAFAVQPQVEGGNVFLPEGWSGADEFVTEFAAFGAKGSKHDDQVDAMTQALNYLRASRFGVETARALCTL